MRHVITVVAAIVLNSRLGEKLPSSESKDFFLALVDTVGCKNSVFVTVYSRKQRLEERKNKGKAVAMEIPFSCPPAGKIRCFGYFQWHCSLCL